MLFSEEKHLNVWGVSGHFLLFLILPLYFSLKTVYLALFGVTVFSTTSDV